MNISVVDSPLQNLYMTELSFELFFSDYVTRHPVDNQVSVSDHVQQQPDEIQATFYVSDVRIGLVDGVPGAALPIQEAEAFLQAIRGKLVAIEVFGYATFTDYVLQSARRRRRGPSSLAVMDLRFTLLRIANSTSVPIPPSNTSNAGAPAPQDIGQQSTSAGRPSLAFQGLQAAGFVE